MWRTFTSYSLPAFTGAFWASPCRYLNPKALSRELRCKKDDFLENRRGIVVSTLTAMCCMGLISLYQIGIIRHLPELPMKGLDADKVDASEEAYRHLDMGDAFIGMASYAVTAGLAAMGGKERARTDPWIPLALAAKAGADAAQAARLTYDQFARHRAGCMWCLIAAAATMTTALLAVPEAKSAYRAARSRHSTLQS